MLGGQLWNPGWSATRCGKGFNKPAGLELEDLFWAHTELADTISQISLAKDVHQNRHYKKMIV